MIDQMKKAHADALDATRAYDRARIAAQLGCEHPHEHVREYQPSSGDWTAYRVCSICGLAEQHYCGFWLLSPRRYDVPHVSANEFHSIRRGWHIQIHEHRSVDGVRCETISQLHAQLRAGAVAR